MSERRELIISNSDQLLQPTTRRRFLGLLGAAGAVVFLPSVFAACSDGESVTDPLDPAAYRLDLSTDTGILNYAYALEQLEAAFYTYVVTTPAPGYTTLSTDEKELFTDLQKHEVIHREFLKVVLADKGIPTISFNATTFASLAVDRATLLKSSQLIEDTGVSAYNGAAKYLSQVANLIVAGKIVSVEARHAAAVRDARDATGKLFAGDDVVSAQGLDVKTEPSAVIAALGSLNVLASPVSIGTGPSSIAATPDQPAPTPA
jgi:hypothetical protein